MPDVESSPMAEPSSTRLELSNLALGVENIKACAPLVEVTNAKSPLSPESATNARQAQWQVG